MSSSSSSSSRLPIAAARQSEKDFEEILSSGRTLVISPGPRETLLASDSDAMNEYDHLELESDFSHSHAGNGDNLAAAVDRNQGVNRNNGLNGSPVSASKVDSQGKVRQANSIDLSSPSRRVLHNSVVSRNSTSSSRRTTSLTKALPLPSAQSSSVLTSRAPSAPVHPASPETSIDTIMKNMPTPTGGQMWPPASTRKPPRSPARVSSAHGSGSASPIKTPPRPTNLSDKEASPASNLASLPVHPHKRDSYRSPKREARTLSSSVTTSPSSTNVALFSAPTFSPSKANGNNAKNSLDKGKSQVDTVAARSASSDKQPNLASAPNHSRQRSISQPAKKALPSRPTDALTAKSAAGSDLIMNVIGLSSEQKDNETRSMFGNQRGGIRSRFKRASNFLRGVGSSSSNGSNTAAKEYAREMQSAPERSPSGREMPVAAPLQKANATASNTRDPHTDALDASASNVSVNSLSSSGTSISVGYRQTMEDWEKSVDDALAPDSTELATRMKIKAPDKHWTPSPRLPEYNLSRKGSFMDEGVVGKDLEDISGTSTDASGSSLLWTSNPDSDPLTPRCVSGTRTFSMPTGMTKSKHVEKATNGPLSTVESAKVATQSSDGRESLFSPQSYDTAKERYPPSTRSRINTRSTSEAEAPSPSDPKLSAPPPLPSSQALSKDEEGLSAPNLEQSIRLVGKHTPGRSTLSNAQLPSLPLPSKAEPGTGKAGQNAPAPDVVAAPRLSKAPAVPPKEEAWGLAGTILGKELADKCWNEDESFRKREKIAEWLGSGGQLNAAARQSYFQKFDFQGLRIDSALRKLCDKLYLRAETQQIDRILSAFSQRYIDCNRDTLFGTVDIIHAVSFSILLLNTDLHVAEIDTRMTRQQFIRNTLDAILESESAPESIRHEAGLDSGRVPSDVDNTLDSGVSPFQKDATSKIDIALREIYSAVKGERIRLPLTDAQSAPSSMRKSRLTGAERVNALKRGSVRGMQGLIGVNRNAVCDEQSTVSEAHLDSPRESRFSIETSFKRAPGQGQSLDRQLPLVSAIGFTESLAQRSVKERNEDEDKLSVSSVTDDLEDDELALLGAPWAKEGILTRKHYYEAHQKRARDKNWVECFVVVQKGTLSMFKFGENGSSISASRKQASTTVGGGNWLSSATCIGQISLAHALADVLPPPGYNRSRPHVFALTLASGSAFFFQAGHEELVAEWVSTCNYWAARLSREPLAAGVSNMEYGWNRVQPISPSDAGRGSEQGSGHASVLQAANSDDRLVASPTESAYFASTHGTQHKDSTDTRSIRSGRSVHSGRVRAAAAASQLPTRRASDRVSFDKVMSPENSSYSDMTSPAPSLGSFNAATTPGSSAPRSAIERPHFVNEWRPPGPSTTTSALSEEEQLEACDRHVRRIQAEVKAHNAVRQPMIDMFKGTLASSGDDRSGFSPMSSTISLPPLPVATASLRDRGGLAKSGMAGEFGSSTSTGSRASRSAASANAAVASKALANWERKSSYLLAELTKAQVYVESLRAASRLRAERRDRRELGRMMRNADEGVGEMRIGT